MSTAVATAAPAVVPDVSARMAHELAVEQKVCVRPLMRRVVDNATGEETTVAIPCGSTREAVCPSCAEKARRLRIQQCAEGWHRSDEAEFVDPVASAGDHADDLAEEAEEAGERRIRSTQRRQDAADLPRIPAEDRTIGRTFAAPDGHVYRPSMFLTLTLPSTGQ